MIQNTEDTKDVKERIFCSALELFTKRGYAATSVREIVTLAQVTKPALYYHFSSKEGLYIALLRGFVTKVESLLEDVSNNYESLNGQLLDLCDKIFLLFSENRDLVRLIHAIYYGPPQGAPFFDFQQFHRKILKSMSNIIRRGIEAGEFRTGLAEDMAWALMGACQVAIEEQLVTEKAQIDRVKLRRILHVILIGINSSRK